MDESQSRHQRESLASSRGGVLCDSSSSESEEEDEDGVAGWCQSEDAVFRFLLELPKASRWRCLLLDRLSGVQSLGFASAADKLEAEGFRTVGGLPAGGKLVEAPRPEPLACSQARAWAWGLLPCQLNCDEA